MLQSSEQASATKVGPAPQMNVAPVTPTQEFDRPQTASLGGISNGYDDIVGLAAPVTATSNLAASPATGQATVARENPAANVDAKPADKDAAEKGKKAEREQAAPAEVKETEAVVGEEADGSAIVGASVVEIPISVSPRSPEEDPEFQRVKAKSRVAAGKLSTHEPASAKTKQAQAAAVGPENEVPSRAAEKHIGVMEQQPAGAFDRVGFKATLRAKIAELTPCSEEDADKFKERGKVANIKGEVGPIVTASKATSQSAIESKTKETPDQSRIPPKPVTDLVLETAGPAPASIGASAAAPKLRTDSEISLGEQSRQLNDEWSTTGLDEPDVARSNEPSFQDGLAQKKQAQADCETRPQQYRQQEAGVVQQAQLQAEETARGSLGAMHTTKSVSMVQVAQGQLGTKTRDEEERWRIASEINTIFSETKSAVEQRLTVLDSEVNRVFELGADAARAAFETYVDQRMLLYKYKRYGIPVVGVGMWIYDRFKGLPKEVNEFYVVGRNDYLEQMDTVIEAVAKIVEKALQEVKQIIVEGKAKVTAYVEALDPKLQGIAREEAEKFQDQFASLEQSIEDKQGQLVDMLAQKYVANLQQLDARIEEMKLANRGIIDVAIEKIRGVYETILQLKNMLLETLARAASVIGKIIKDPIGFLGNLVTAVKDGVLGFRDRIGMHLQNGLMEWLMGSLSQAGITLPDNFDLEGIFGLVMQVLGLTYENIRARAVAIVGEPVVKTLEVGAEIFHTLLTEGPAGLWDLIKESVGDLKTMILDGIKDFVIEKLIVAGVTWLISMLNPASAFIKACKMIYDIVMFVVQRASQIMQFVNAVLDSVSAIADGALSAASAAVENALARSIPVVLGFFAALLNLNGISDQIRSIVEKIRAPINKAIDWIILKAASLVKSLLRKDEGKSEEMHDHRSIAKDAVTELENTPNEDYKDYKSLRGALEDKADALEPRYNQILEEGIRMHIEFAPQEPSETDSRVEFTVIIAPNDEILDGSVATNTGLSPQPGLHRALQAQGTAEGEGRESHHVPAKGLLLGAAAWLDKLVSDSSINGTPLGKELGDRSQKMRTEQEGGGYNLSAILISGRAHRLKAEGEWRPVHSQTIDDILAGYQMLIDDSVIIKDSSTGALEYPRTALGNFSSNPGKAAWARFVERKAPKRTDTVASTAKGMINRVLESSLSTAYQLGLSAVANALSQSKEDGPTPKHKDALLGLDAPKKETWDHNFFKPL